MLWLRDEGSANMAKDACSGHRPGAEAPPLSARFDVAVRAARDCRTRQVMLPICREKLDLHTRDVRSRRIRNCLLLPARRRRATSSTRRTSRRSSPQLALSRTSGFIKPLNDVTHGIAIEGAIQLLRYITNVRCREHIGQLTQRVRIVERFGVVYVQCGAGNLTGRERA